jgi:hypothetical protein
MTTHLLLTRQFGPDQAALAAYNQRPIGLREVPIAAITGTVGRPGLCNPRRMALWRRTPRYRRILQVAETGQPLPPVSLALLGGQYYIADGHHRLAALRQIGALEADADVIEYLPSTESPAAVWHRARAAFERDTGLIGLHLRQVEGYEWLRRQIAEHGWYLGEQGGAPRSFAAAAIAWERAVYWPVLGILSAHGVPDRQPALTPSELYLAVCDHKWYRSERLARDIGFAAAVADYGRGRHLPWPQRFQHWLAAGRRALSVPRLLLAIG